MNWMMLKVVARTMTRTLKLKRWLLVIIFFLSICQPVGLASAQPPITVPVPGFPHVSLQLPLFIAPIEDPEDIYTELGCLIKPYELIVAGPPDTPDIINASLRSIYSQDELPESLRDFFIRDDQPPFFEPVDAYELTFPVYRSIPFEDGEAQVAFLYRGPDIDILEAIINSLYRSADLEGDQGDIPTYATANRNYPIFILEGAGGSGGQSPGGNPFGTSPVDATEARYSDFMAQWAIREITGTVMYGEHDDHGGDGVVVAVFDSSPFQANPFSQSKALDIKEAPENVPTVSLTHYYRPTSGPSIDHGVFVVGLIKAVAPDADVHLYRTFNDSGGADVYALGRQVARFSADFLLSSSGNGESNPPRFVANMSFSFQCPFGQDFEYDKLAEQVNNVNDAIDSLVNSNVVVVAAAGNIANNNYATVESTVTSIVTSTATYTITPTLTPTITSIVTSVVTSMVTSTVTLPISSIVSSTTASGLPPQQFPASREDVIGVGALDSESGHSCFTNGADIFMPGGGAVDGDSCFEPYYDCTTEHDCPAALMSFSTSSKTTGLAYWNGSSFAAPLASGLVALWLSNPTTANPVDPSERPVDRVINELRTKTFPININVR